MTPRFYPVHPKILQILIQTLFPNAALIPIAQFLQSDFWLFANNSLLKKLHQKNHLYLKFFAKLDVLEPNLVAVKI